MTSQELRRLLEEAGLSQRGAARQLGIDERTMRRYCADDGQVPRLVELAVRFLHLQRLANSSR